MRAFILLLALALAGCVSPTDGGGVVLGVPKVVVEASGTGSAQGFLGTIPVTGRFRWQGDGSIVFQAVPPYLVFDGGMSFVVEPWPGDESRAAASVARGEVVVLRGGMPAALVRPGTIR